MTIIRDAECDFFSWISALYEVINIADTCDDAYRNFKVIEKPNVREYGSDGSDGAASPTSLQKTTNSFIDTKKDAALENVDDLDFENIIEKKKKISLDYNSPQKERRIKPTVQLIPSPRSGFKFVQRQSSIPDDDNKDND